MNLISYMGVSMTVSSTALSTRQPREVGTVGVNMSLTSSLIYLTHPVDCECAPWTCDIPLNGSFSDTIYSE
jgi:hypothetical protein